MSKSIFAFTFAMAAACAAAMPALAADARIDWRGLDLTSEAGKAELDRRIDAAAETLCASDAMTGTRLPPRAPPRCLAEARTLIADKIAEQRRATQVAARPGAPRTADARPR